MEVKLTMPKILMSLLRERNRNLSQITLELLLSMACVLSWSSSAWSCPTGYRCIAYQAAGIYTFVGTGIKASTQADLNAAVLAVYSQVDLPNSNTYTAFAFGAPIDSTHWQYCSWTAQFFNGCGGTVSFTGSLCQSYYADNGEGCQISLAAQDPAQNTGTPPAGSCQGNPCNAGTGNKYQTELDYVGMGTYPLQMGRVYNSGDATPSAVDISVWGSQWRGFYDRNIVYSSNGIDLKTAALKRADGKTYYFNQAIGTAAVLPLTTTTWTPDAYVVGYLVELSIDAGGSPTGWRYLNENDEAEVYDAVGRLVSITNRSGLTQTLTYSCMPISATCLVATPMTIAPIAGLLITVMDSFGRTLSFTYDSSSRVKTMTDPLSSVYNYAYSGIAIADNLTTVSYPDGSVLTHLYGEAADRKSTRLNSSHRH